MNSLKISVVYLKVEERQAILYVQKKKSQTGQNCRHDTALKTKDWAERTPLTIKCADALWKVNKWMSLGQ